MFLRTMPRLHIVIKNLIRALGEEQAEAAIQGTVVKPAAKKHRGTKDKESDDDVVTIELTRREFKGMLVTLMEIDKSLRDRLYVVQVACESGWKMAKNLSAVNQGNAVLLQN